MRNESVLVVDILPHYHIGPLLTHCLHVYSLVLYYHGMILGCMANRTVYRQMTVTLHRQHSTGQEVGDNREVWLLTGGWGHVISQGLDMSEKNKTVLRLLRLLVCYLRCCQSTHFTGILKSTNYSRIFMTDILRLGNVTMTNDLHDRGAKH